MPGQSRNAGQESLGWGGPTAGVDGQETHTNLRAAQWHQGEPGRFQQQEAGATSPSEGELMAPYLHLQSPHFQAETKPVCPTSQDNSSRPWQSKPWGQVVVIKRGKGSKKKGAHFNPAETPSLLYKQKIDSPELLLTKQRLRPVPFPLAAAGPFARKGFKCLQALRPHSAWQGLGRGWKPQQIVTWWPFTERQGGGEYVFTTLSTQGGRQEVSLP